MITEKLVTAAKEFAYSEIEKFGLPTKLHFDISFEKGDEIAVAMNADKSLVELGVCFMDIKLGEAFSQKRIDDHIKMGVDACNEFLKDYEVTEEEKSKIINCIVAHHGTVPFSSLESEIVANADCYRFIHPKGVIHYIGTLTKRNLSLPDIVKQAEYKLDEKQAILSMDYCKKELIHHYDSFKAIFAVSK
ncbi:MAG: hypothetical protein IPG18_12290 [Saprospiraceae bacterium]|nr:hypothetical protein [Saprospiraceae bacterium]MBK8370042.1 hypothetical protein [Saprospiraceae bacterium]